MTLVIIYKKSQNRIELFGECTWEINAIYYFSFSAISTKFETCLLLFKLLNFTIQYNIEPKKLEFLYCFTNP